MRFCLQVLALAGLCGLSAAALAQEKKPAGHDADEPGPVHKQLAQRVGDYTTVSRFWIKPGAEPMESKGTATLTSILGGRFLREDSTGTMFGQPTAGFRLTGYNNATGRYEATWAYTGSTAIMRLIGTSPDDGKTIQWTATYELKKGEKTTLSVTTRHADGDHFTVTLSATTPEGEKGPTLETTYTRRK